VVARWRSAASSPATMSSSLLSDGDAGGRGLAARSPRLAWPWPWPWPMVEQSGESGGDARPAGLGNAARDLKPRSDLVVLQL
jgi:hypothetical protein